MLVLKKYNLEYQNKTVFDNTSFFARNGQVTLITGESGSGKTTLLHTLCFHTLFSGEYSYNDVVLSSLSEHEKQIFYSEKICMIEQQPSFLKNLTIEQHFELFNLKIDDLYLNKVIKKLNISKLLKEYPNQLSDGEKKRVSLCIALIRNAEILIIDEPTASLDEEYTEVICQLLYDYAKQGHYVIVASHDINMKGHADSIWEIDYQKLNIINENEQESGGKCNVVNLKMKFKFYISMFINYVKKKFLSFVIMSILIAFIGVSYEFNNVSISTHKEIVNELSSKEILIYKSSNTGQFNYSDNGQETPLTENELTNLKGIKELTNIEWRYDESLAGNLDENIKLYLFESLNDLNKQIKVLDKDKIIIEGIKDYQNTIQNTYVKTYTSNIEVGSKIDKKFAQEGLYLSQEFAQILSNNNIDILKGKELQLPINIPIYNVSGVTSMVSESGEAFECNAIASKRIVVTLPIAGVLKSSSLYDNDSGSLLNQIFIPKQIYEENIENYKQDQEFTIYYVKENETLKQYIDVIPKDKKGDITQIIKVTKWIPDCYVATIDNLENLEEVLKQINDIGLNAKSVYINSSSLKQSIESLQRSVQIAGGVILIIVLLAGYQMKKSNKQSENEMNNFLRNFGLLSKQIKKIKVQRNLIFFITQSIVSVVMSGVIILILNSTMNGNTNWTLITGGIIIGILFIIEFIYPTIIELKKQKR